MPTSFFVFYPFQIALGECYRVRFCGIRSRAFVQNLYVSCLYKELGSFLFGCCVGQSLTNMAKLSVGRLRPNFLSVCNITYASINCTPGSYVSQVSCNQSSSKALEEARYVASVLMSIFKKIFFVITIIINNLLHLLLNFSFRKSFFSGHASFAMYTMLYLAVSHVLNPHSPTHAHTKTHKPGI